MLVLEMIESSEQCTRSNNGRAQESEKEGGKA